MACLFVDVGNWNCILFYHIFRSESVVNPFFGDNIVREITIQWKVYGALVGS